MIGRSRPVFFVPNIVDSRFAYDPVKRVPHERFTILFGAFGGRASAYKGWPDLAAALERLPDAVKEKTVVNVFGETAEDCQVSGVDVHFLGKIENGPALVAEHHKADILALPSRHDNAPQVKFEALLDGLPVIVFARTGCAEFLRHKENGWVADDGDIDAYAAGLQYYFDLFSRGELEVIRASIASDASDRFSSNTILEKMMSVYGEIASTQASPINTYVSQDL